MSFNSLFKVLFIFPSQYLFAIGFRLIFSLGRSLSPYSCFNPKKHYSENAAVDADLFASYGDFTLSVSTFQQNYAINHCLACTYRLQFVPYGKIFILG